MSSFASTTREICNFYFSIKDKSIQNEFICKCGRVRKKSKSSWQNLMTHIRELHPDYIEQMVLVKSSSNSSMVRFVDSKSKNIWGWLKFIVGKGVAFNWCEDPVMRDFSNLKLVSVETLQKYMELLANKIERKI